MVQILLTTITMAQKIYTSYSKVIVLATILHYLQHLNLCKAAPVSSIGDRNINFIASLRDTKHLDNNYISERVLDHNKDVNSNHIPSESETNKKVHSNDKLVEVEYTY